ncbi:hypothetical protein [Variovorax rhizosphaerae]|uniref:Uncharacterized protein n=1 Tax=Variovorax rhizosphaerae TaxID=1836200 RepID=A0ABU8WZ05_9BURK
MPTLTVPQWRALMQTRALAYFEGLRSLGVAAVEHHRVSGRTFLDVTIERRRFTGKVFDGPFLVAETNKGECPLNASIARLAGGAVAVNADRWALCKYGSQAQFELDGMSQLGIRALACEFGVLIQGDAGMVELSETESFAVSNAHAALLDWTERQPVLARRRLRNDPAFLQRLETSRPVTRRSLFRKLEEFEYFSGPQG